MQTLLTKTAETSTDYRLLLCTTVKEAVTPPQMSARYVQLDILPTLLKMTETQYEAVDTELKMRLETMEIPLIMMDALQVRA